MRKLRILSPLVLFTTITFSQTKSFQTFLDSGKVEFKRQASSDTPNYSKAFDLLSNAVRLKPDNAEARYFLGYTIDRLNGDDGSKMILSKRDLTVKASEEFEKVNQIQKEYTGEILILDPYSKLTSIWSSLAQSYLTKNLVDSAKWAFREGKVRGGFIEPLLEFNRQTLNSCQRNSILITYGDNVTFPILYLQTIEQFRTDITVVDANLLNAAWYPKYLKNIQKLPIGLTDAQIDSIDYISWTATEIAITNPNDPLQIVSWILKPTYFDKYILKGDRILLDIFKQNLFKRDFYFSGSSDSTYNLFLTDYIIDDGIVSRVILKKNDLTTPTTIISKNLASYSIDKLDAGDIKKSRDAIMVLNGYRWSYCSNSYFLITKGEKELARKLLAEMELKFDRNKLPYSSEEFERQVEELKRLAN